MKFSYVVIVGCSRLGLLLGNLNVVTAWLLLRGRFRAVTRSDEVRQVGTFVFPYLLTYVLGAAVLAAHGYGLRESLFEYASAVGTVGLSVGVTTAAAPAGVLWAESLGMFLGRLEFYVVLMSAVKLLRDVPRLARR